MKSVPTQDCLRKSFNTHLRKILTRRLRPKQNSLRNFSTVPFLYKPNHLQKRTWLRWSGECPCLSNRLRTRKINVVPSFGLQFRPWCCGWTDQKLVESQLIRRTRPPQHEDRILLNQEGTQQEVHSMRIHSLHCRIL